MLFNSFPFLLCFLPITLAGFFLLGKRGETLGAAWLAATSLFFYAWWYYRYIALLLLSISVNYGMGRRIAEAGTATKKHWLSAAIALNLSLLGYYKYADFFLSSLTVLTGTQHGPLSIALPIGISFLHSRKSPFLSIPMKAKSKNIALSIMCCLSPIFRT